MLPITLEQIELDVEVESPVDAIRAAGNLLVKTESASSDYVDAMVASYEKLGPYIVYSPSTTYCNSTCAARTRGEKTMHVNCSFEKTD